LNAVTEIFAGVDQEVLPRVFESWVNRPRWFIKHEWKYYTESRKNKRHFFKIAREKGRIGTYEPPISKGRMSIVLIQKCDPPRHFASHGC
jgi:hypothetical protein